MLNEKDQVMLKVNVFPKKCVMASNGEMLTYFATEYDECEVKRSGSPVLCILVMPKTIIRVDLNLPKWIEKGSMVLFNLNEVALSQ